MNPFARLYELYRFIFPAKPDLQAARKAAMARYEDAVRRGDTRAMHEAWPALKATTDACLRAGR